MQEMVKHKVDAAAGGGVYDAHPATTYFFKLGGVLSRPIQILENGHKLPLLRVAHGMDPLGLGLGGTSIQCIPVIHVIVAVVRHKHPVPTPVSILHTHAHSNNVSPRPS
jgi:hypothetical protein